MGRTFDLGTVLTITTGRLLVEDIGKIYKALNYMTQDSLFTHQIPRASKQCAPVILGLYPELQCVSGDDVTTENWREWLVAKVEEYGNDFELTTLLFYTSRNPIEELAEMVDPEKIIAVVI